MNEDKSWVLWIILPLAILGWLLAAIIKAASQSVFDESE